MLRLTLDALSRMAWDPGRSISHPPLARVMTRMHLSVGLGFIATLSGPNTTA